jgi:hypothetical protein
MQRRWETLIGGYSGQSPWVNVGTMIPGESHKVRSIARAADRLIGTKDGNLEARLTRFTAVLNL